MKRHHRMFWYEYTRKSSLKREFYFFLQQEAGIGNPVAHLREILDRHVRDRVGVNLARGLKFREQFCPIIPSPVQYLNQRCAIFKAAVDALPEEWNDGMRRVA